MCALAFQVTELVRIMILLDSKSEYLNKIPLVFQILTYALFLYVLWYPYFHTEESNKNRSLLQSQQITIAGEFDTATTFDSQVILSLLFFGFSFNVIVKLVAVIGDFFKRSIIGVSDKKQGSTCIIRQLFIGYYNVSWSISWILLLL